MMQKNQIETQTLVMLGILFLAFVVGDLTTTIWLINNYPGGIEGESNPWGVLLFSLEGVTGMIFVKVAVFLVLTTSVILMEYFYKHDKNVMRISHYTIIGLTGWSLIIVTINVMIMYILSMQGQSHESEFLPQLYGIMFGMIFAFLVVLPKFYPSDLKTIQVALSVLVVFFPIAFFPEIYQNMFLQDTLITVTFFGAISSMIAVMIIATNRLYKVKKIFSYHIIKHSSDCIVHTLSKIEENLHKK